jgi:hypothetical protein
VNADRARQLRLKLKRVYPAATDIAVAPQPDGALIVLSGVRSAGNSEPGGGDVRMSIGNGDGPVLRMILSGRV